MQNHHHQTNQTGKPNSVALFFNMLKEKAKEILAPEEVEITFEEEEGKITGYTYTKVQHKQVA